MSEVKNAIDKAWITLASLCTRGKVRISIPVCGSDDDQVIGTALNLAIERITNLEAENLKLQTYLAGWHRYALYDNEKIREIQENEVILRGEVESHDEPTMQ